jgi:HEPN domain-containing protein
MAERAADWMAQARRDVENARYNRTGGYFEWACFAAQQAAEKALKAAYQSLGGDAWGHSVFGLLQGLGERIEVSARLVDVARQLDRYYIPSRYPNGWSAGAPMDMFIDEDAQSAIAGADEILRFCEGVLARP